MKVADLVVSRLVRAGARAIFGMPGGGSTLDVIAAARDHGIRFVLSHTETAGAIMAAAQAEITGAPGVCLSTLGPGVSSITNGVAHAWLDRVPLVVLTDVMEPAARARYEHQNLSHGALLGPITKFTSELTATGMEALLEEALARALADPPGPVHLDCAPSTMSADTESPSADRREQIADRGERITNSRERIADSGQQTAGSGSRAAAFLSPAARRLLGNARRPLVIAGLGARRCGDAAALRPMCDRHGVPALVTYKAKGVIGDGHPSYAGLFTLGEIEKPLVERADVLLTVGLDPVELLPRPWPWEIGRAHV